MSRQKQQGIVIVMALFIVALVASMSYIMIARLERDTYRTTLILRNMEAQNIAQGSVAWAIDALMTNWQKKVDNQLVDKMPQMSPVMQEQGFTVSSTLYDMQARFNLNSVKSKEAAVDFARLIQLVAPKVKKPEAEAIGSALMRWITQGGSTDSDSQYYLKLKPPYRARHAPMFNASELRLVKGVSAEIYQALRPYITALPDTALLNVQTMSPEAMVTLSNDMTIASGKSAAALRAQKPFVSKQAFLNTDVAKNHHVPEAKITAVSDYFLLETKVTIEKERVVIYTLLMRKEKEKKASVSIVWQSKGSW